MSNIEIIREYAIERTIEYSLDAVQEALTTAMTQSRSASFTSVTIGSNGDIAEEINDINEELEQLQKRVRELKRKHYEEFVRPLFDQYVDTI